MAQYLGKNAKYFLPLTVKTLFDTEFSVISQVYLQFLQTTLKKRLSRGL